MFTVLEFTKFAELAAHHENVVVYKEVATDQLTPTQIYAAIADTAQDITLLESNPNEKEQGRYSHLCFNPLLTISVKEKTITITEENGCQEIEDEPFKVLRQYYNKLRCVSENNLCKFAGGFVGFMSYDAITYIEDIKGQQKSDLPAILFHYYKNHISFDHQTGKLMLATVVQVNASADVEGLYNNAIAELEKITIQLQTPVKLNHFSSDSNFAMEKVATDISDSGYCEMVEQAKQYIVGGDIFQVVLSREFSLPVSANSFDIYRALRFSNPSPHMFYFSVEGTAIAGASPEKLVSIADGIVEVRPLAGTRARGQKPDAELAEDLLNDEKEMAEHMMLVDLGRNDVGRIAKPGTVKVTKLADIEYYSRVIHISSTVQGELEAGKDAFDALQATFIAGTLSGAPKVRAMEIIAELEKSPRGIYSGVVCGIDGAGNMDSAIAIRMATIKDGVAKVRAGAGLVYDSDPQAEANESRHKAKAILEGISLAEEMQA